MRLLVWDTTGSRGQLVARQGTRSLALEWTQEKTQSEWLFRSLHAACDAMDWSYGSVQGLGVVVGPGSFTGIRVGIAVARAWKAVFPHVEAYAASALALQQKAFPARLHQSAGVIVVRPAATGEVYARVSGGHARDRAHDPQTDALLTLAECGALRTQNPDFYWVCEGGEKALHALLEKGQQETSLTPSVPGLDRVLDWDPSALSRWSERLSTGTSLGGDHGWMGSREGSGDWAPHYLREPDATRNLRKRLAPR